jgi:hypothetical protein
MLRRSGSGRLFVAAPNFVTGLTGRQKAKRQRSPLAKSSLFLPRLRQGYKQGPPLSAATGGAAPQNLSEQRRLKDKWKHCRLTLIYSYCEMRVILIYHVQASTLSDSETPGNKMP